MNKVPILSSRISTGSFHEMVGEICTLASEKRSSYICVANVHMLIEAEGDSDFREILNGADMATPDGKPLALGIRWLYGKPQDRVAGMDLMPELLGEAERRGLSVFFLGSTDEVLEEIRRKAQESHPNLRLAGSCSPPFRPLSEAEKLKIIDQINDSGADFVFVALGCPKQEKWMAHHKGKVQACMIGLGGAFPVYANMQKRAPMWMQKVAMEWVFRLVQEPKRLWKRYFVTNTSFIYLFTTYYVKHKLRKHFIRPKLTN